MNQASKYERLQACLAGYISSIMVETVLKSAMRRMGVDRERIAEAKLDELVSNAMLSLRLFVDPNRLPMLMVDLAALVDDDASHADAASSVAE